MLRSNQRPLPCEGGSPSPAESRPPSLPGVSPLILQALFYQLAWIVILAVGWTVAGILTVVLIGFLLFPVMIVATLVPLVHMGYAAYQVSQGVDYRYPFIADMIDANRRTGTS